MAQRNRAHIRVDGRVDTEPYTRPPRKIDETPVSPPDDRGRHGQALAAQLKSAETVAATRRQAVADEHMRAEGIYVTFASAPDVALALESLDPQAGTSHPELVAVRTVSRGEEVTEEEATVFIPDGKLGYFLKRLEAYAETSHETKGKNRNLVDRIASIRLSSLEQLWTDAPEQFPEHSEPTWWEVWLRRREGQELDRVKQFADAVGVELGKQVLLFPDRSVVLVRATADQLSNALSMLDFVAELRRPAQRATVLASESATQQADWVSELAERTEAAPEDSPSACILDTGVYAAHPLLEPSLPPDDCHSADPAWGVDDHDGHGTEMAGLALFGDLEAALLRKDPVQLIHRLESVTILPPAPGTNPPELYGAITGTATSLVEIERPDRSRLFSLSVTAGWDTPGPEAGRPIGQPTSWSATIDALAVGLDVDFSEDGLLFLNDETLSEPRLFAVSAGNVRELGAEYLNRADLTPVEDPAQAWNALTVGAYTNFVDASSGKGFDGWKPLAPAGELSPFSRTGVLFARVWPHKPDVVFEGGNVAQSPDETILDTPDTLGILTTRAPLGSTRRLTVTRETSAATAQAAHMGASIMSVEPGLWPETIRALIVHSAEWTPPMRTRFKGAKTRAQRVALLRRYGMGVPDLTRATRSATDALTLITEEVIRPFDGEGRTREMHIHDLPWPTDVLSTLGEAEVRMRVTLSYFIEPNPARRGWVRRYSYASHGLRFEVRRPTESTTDFRKRINRKARAEGERHSSSESDSQEWFFGPDQRASGSLHSDIWEGTAADLAERGVIGVFPVGGWWKEQKHRDHSERGARYALVVSIETPGQDVDIWTPVAQEVGIEVPIET